MSVTIYDISEKAGVSIATVSRVLNGSTKVKESTRKKIMDIIDEYGYTPNSSARAMGLKAMQTIGILCADSSDIFLAKAVHGLTFIGAIWMIVVSTTTAASKSDPCS